MPKFKPHKGLRKRVKVSAKGKIVRKKAGKSHLLSNKSGKRLRRLRRADLIRPEFTRTLLRALGED